MHPEEKLKISSERRVRRRQWRSTTIPATPLGETGLLEAAHLSKRFGTTAALDDVTLRVEPGEIHCLLGANGARQTTLLNIFFNFLDPTGGEVRINGLDITRHALETKRHVAGRDRGRPRTRRWSARWSS
jgi:ABC-type Na+ transport system ATPase subunit NatA